MGKASNPDPSVLAVRVPKRTHGTQSFSIGYRYPIDTVHDNRGRSNFAPFAFR